MFHAKAFANSRKLCLIAAIAISGGFFGGCQQMATYPGVEVTAKYQRPAAEPVPTIIAESVKYAKATYLNGEDLPINLPANVPSTVYDKVFTHLDGGRPMVFPDEPAIHITEIRTRTMNAQVDMIYPSSKGYYQFVTLTLGHNVFEHWRVTGERKWAMGAVTPPSPNYVPPAPEESEKTMANAGG